jgi:hypothetical protein
MMWFWGGSSGHMTAGGKDHASLYDIKVQDLSGDIIGLDKYKDYPVILVVNTTAK